MDPISTIQGHKPQLNKYIYALLLISMVIYSCRRISVQDQDTCTSRGSQIQYRKWIVSEPILEAGTAGSYDEIAVKDPTIVLYNNRYHMFYTGKATYETRDSLPHLSKNGSGLGYVSAASIEELGNASRYDMSRIIGSVIVAPQVFYFEPHQLWYIIAQTLVEGKPDLMPIYMTNPDIDNVHGWSSPEILKTNKSSNGFWIDFWIICDADRAHLFYTDHMGSLFRFECPLDEFPGGFEDQQEETVLTVRSENSTGRWRMHEASHIYYVRKHNCYLNIMEAVYPHPTRRNYWESRNRFLFAMVADKLEGPWARIESGLNDFLGDPTNLYDEQGRQSIYDQVSHPELIRSGYNQDLEIEDYNLQLLFQAFDADTIGSDYDYNYLPWKILLMKNH